MYKTTFYRFKTSWILLKKITRRDTCLCKVHVNFNLLILKLSYLNALYRNDIHSFIQTKDLRPKKSKLYVY